jgi:hypothetical protein
MTEKSNPMKVSPTEAEESLVAIQNITQKTRHSVASSGAYVSLIVTGIVWLVGFLSTQYLPGPITAIIWIGMSILGSVVGVLLGNRLGRRVRNPAIGVNAKRAAIFWLLLIFFCIAAIAVAGPTDGKQVTMYVILFIMIGQLSMGLLISYATVWWSVPIAALGLVGYFLLPDIFYLWMGVLGGGGMIAFGLYIRSRW